MEHAIWERIHEKELITSLKIQDIQETSTASVNEMIGLVAQQDNFTNESLKELVFNQWDFKIREKYIKEPLEDSVIESLFRKC